MPGDIVLEATDIEVRFGGLVALGDVAINARAGEVTGLMGPNGAGKSTFLAVASGLQVANRGELRILGQRMLGKPPQAFALQGVGRTFQSPQLVRELSVLEHIVLGERAHNYPPRLVRDILGIGRSRKPTAEEAERANELLTNVGLIQFAERTPEVLPMGTRRLIEVAQCLALRPKLLLLDEPSAGLNRVETSALATMVTRVCKEEQIAVLLVEHNLDLVLTISDRIFVLDFGKLIAEGTPDEIKASPAVQEAYLGKPAAAI
jgi:branched-chain amino acid transport system ATP-binding protein